MSLHHVVRDSAVDLNIHGSNDASVEQKQGDLVKLGFFCGARKVQKGFLAPRNDRLDFIASQDEELDMLFQVREIDFRQLQVILAPGEELDESVVLGDVKGAFDPA